ncbi:cytochrome P450 [Streptomyces thermogriseus]|jgi:biflaviolin synthase|uniref:Cytochrome P450 n=1 Tax=Streptomyces thermogriseus TaxID=75292 RepID=A0ABP4DDG9_9ACTN
MTEETLTEPLPPVRHWPVLDPAGVGLDPVLADLMRKGPVARVALPGGEGWAWLVTRMDDVRRVTGDPRFGRTAALEHGAARPAPHPAPAHEAIGLLDPSDHARLRRVIAPALSAHGVERVRESSRRMLDELVDGLLRDGPPADLVHAVLGPFPSLVVCELMGVPPADRHGVRTWARRVLSSPHGAGEQAREEMGAYFAELVDARLESTGEDIASLLGAAVGCREITLREAVDLAVLLQTGGEAVGDSGGQLFHLLLTRPELAERLRREPGIRPRAVEELLRYLPHRNALGPPRVVLEDLSVKGVRMRAGDVVHVSYLAANRDPDVFPDPESVDFSRTPNPHVAFGSGPHHCPGGPLTRLVMELLVDALLDRVPGLRPAVPADQVPFGKGASARGPESLPVTW